MDSSIANVRKHALRGEFDPASSPCARAPASRSPWRTTGSCSPILYYVDQNRNPATKPEALAELLARGAGAERFWLTLFVLEKEVTNDPAEVERMDARIAEERARLAGYGYENEETARTFGGAALGFVRR